MARDRLGRRMSLRGGCRAAKTAESMNASSSRAVAASAVKPASLRGAD
jgi:hypothetical protein